MFKITTVYRGRSVELSIDVSAPEQQPDDLGEIVCDDPLLLDEILSGWGLFGHGMDRVTTPADLVYAVRQLGLEIQYIEGEALAGIEIPPPPDGSIY